MNDILKLTKTYDFNMLLNKEEKIKKNLELEQAAEEFESLFVNEMFKRAHSAKLAKNILTSDAEETYTSILNQERAKILAKKHDFGIAKALVNQFSGRSSASKEVNHKNTE